MRACSFGPIYAFIFSGIHTCGLGARRTGARARSNAGIQSVAVSLPADVALPAEQPPTCRASPDSGSSTAAYPVLHTAVACSFRDPPEESPRLGGSTRASPSFATSAFNAWLSRASALMPTKILNHSLGDGVCYDMMTAGIQVGVVHGVVQGLARDFTRLSQCLIQIDREHT